MRYLMLEMVGKGSFGCVYKCIDKRNGSTIAMKITRSEINHKSRELAIIRQLNHINCIQLIDSFLFSVDEGEDDKEDNELQRRQSNSIIFQAITTKYYPHTLEKLIEKKQLKSNELIRHLMLQLCRAVAYIHSLDICHRDIKPSNILISDEYELVLSDFGCSKVLSNSPIELENTVYVGSRYYRAPEMIIGLNYTKAIDVWAMGCVIYQTYTGKPPFMGTTDFEQISFILSAFPLLGSELFDDIDGSWEIYGNRNGNGVFDHQNLPDDIALILAEIFRFKNRITSQQLLDQFSRSNYVL